MEPQNPAAPTNTPNTVPDPAVPAPAPAPAPVAPVVSPTPESPAVAPLGALTPPVSPVTPATSADLTPATPPQPASPFPPQPPAAPAPDGDPAAQPAAPAPAFQAASQSVKKPKKPLLFILIGLIVVILGVGGYFGYTMFFASLKTEAYKGDGFTMLVPTGYEKEDEAGRISFTEPGNEDTASAIVAQVGSYPQVIKDDQIDEVRTAFKESMESNLGDLAGPGEEIKNTKITDTTHNGNKAVRITGDFEKDGVKQQFLMLAGFTTEDYYIVAFRIDSTDPGFEKKVETMVESFKLQ